MSATENSEPTMEEILASIRKIIADEQEGDPQPPNADVRSAGNSAAKPAGPGAPGDDIFDLDDPVDLGPAKPSRRPESLLMLADDAPASDRLMSDEVERHATGKQ